MKNIRLSCCEFPHDLLTSLLRSHCELNRKLVRTSCKSFPIPCGHSGINLNWPSGLWIGPFLNVKRPQQLRDSMEKVTIREVDSWAQSSPISYLALVGSGFTEGVEPTVAIMVSILVIGRVGILRSQQRVAFIMIRIKSIRIREFRFVLMKTPDIDEDDGSLR